VTPPTIRLSAPSGLFFSCDETLELSLVFGEPVNIARAEIPFLFGLAGEQKPTAPTTAPDPTTAAAPVDGETGPSTPTPAPTVPTVEAMPVVDMGQAKPTRNVGSFVISAYDRFTGNARITVTPADSTSPIVLTAAPFYVDSATNVEYVVEDISGNEATQAGTITAVCETVPAGMAAVAGAATTAAGASAAAAAAAAATSAGAGAAASASAGSSASAGGGGAGGATAAGGSGGIISLVQMLQRQGATTNVLPEAATPSIRLVTDNMACIFAMGCWASPLDEDVFFLSKRDGSEEDVPTGRRLLGDVPSRTWARWGGEGGWETVTVALRETGARGGRAVLSAEEEALSEGGWEVLTAADRSFAAANRLVRSAWRRSLAQEDSAEEGVDAREEFLSRVLSTSSNVQAGRRLFWASVCIVGAGVIRVTWRILDARSQRKKGVSEPKCPAFLRAPKFELFVGLIVVAPVAEAAGFLMQGVGSAVFTSSMLLILGIVLVGALTWSIAATQLFSYPEERHVAYVVPDEEHEAYVQKCLNKKPTRFAWLTAWLGVRKVLPAGEWTAFTPQGKAILSRFGVLFDAVGGPPVARVGATYELIGAVELPCGSGLDRGLNVHSSTWSGDVDCEEGPEDPDAGHSKNRVVYVPRFDRGCLVPVRSPHEIRLEAQGIQTRARGVLASYLRLMSPSARLVLTILVVVLMSSVGFSTTSDALSSIVGAVFFLTVISFGLTAGLAPMTSPSEQLVDSLSALAEVISMGVLWSGHLTLKSDDEDSLDKGKSFSQLLFFCLVFVVGVGILGQIYAAYQGVMMAREVAATLARKAKIAEKILAVIEKVGHHGDSAAGKWGNEYWRVVLTKKYANRWLGRIRRNIPGWPGMYNLTEEQEVAWHAHLLRKSLLLGAARDEGAVLHRIRITTATQPRVKRHDTTYGDARELAAYELEAEEELAGSLHDWGGDASEYGDANEPDEECPSPPGAGTPSQRKRALSMPVETLDRMREKAARAREKAARAKELAKEWGRKKSVTITRAKENARVWGKEKAVSMFQSQRKLGREHTHLRLAVLGSTLAALEASRSPVGLSQSVTGTSASGLAPGPTPEKEPSFTELTSNGDDSKKEIRNSSRTVGTSRVSGASSIWGWRWESKTNSRSDGGEGIE